MHNYNKEWWDKLTKHDQVTIISDAIRGAIIDSFINIESRMAEIAIVVDFNSDYEGYFKGFKPTMKIIEDFLSCYDKIEPLASKYFTDKETFKEDILFLADIRNRAAHFILFAEKNVLAKTDPLQDIYFFSIRKSKYEVCSLRNSLLKDYYDIIIQFVERFLKLQVDVHSTFHIPHVHRDALKEIESAKQITIKPNFPSLK